MKLKGHTKIELTDVRTGEVEIYEEDNLVTGFATALFQQLGAVNTFGISALHTATPFRDFFGGILCLDTALAEDANGYHIPEGVKMTANGSYGTANSSSVTEMGSFNSTESGLSEDGTSYTFVYDWTTSQGNGIINCVCLTNPSYGYIGCGNATSMVRHSTSGNLIAYSGTPTGQVASGSSAQRSSELAWADTKNNKIGLFRGNLYSQISSGTITIDVYSYPFSEIAPLRSISMNAYTASNKKLLETVTFTLSGNQPKTNLNYSTVRLAFFEDKTALIIQNNQNQSNYKYIIEIAPDGTLNEWQTGTLTWGQWGGQMQGATYNDDYLVVVHTNSGRTIYLSIYDRNNGTVTTTTVGQYSVDKYLCNIKGRIIGNAWELDADGNIIPTNGNYGNDSDLHYIQGCAYGDPDTLITYSFYGAGTNTSTDYQTYFYRNENWISTINNMDTTLTKTSDKTMKITYTISEAS